MLNHPGTITETLSVEELKELTRATLEEIWAQVHADYDKAIEMLPVQAPITGRATLGAALGMKMRAYLYQGQWEKVIQYADKVTDLGIYELFSSYKALFPGGQRK